MTNVHKLLHFAHPFVVQKFHILYMNNILCNKNDMTICTSQNKDAKWLHLSRLMNGNLSEFVIKSWKNN